MTAYNDYSIPPGELFTCQPGKWTRIPGWDASLPAGRCDIEAVLSLSGLTPETRPTAIYLQRVRLRPGEAPNPTHKVTYAPPAAGSYWGIEWFDLHSAVTEGETWYFEVRVDGPAPVQVRPVEQKGRNLAAYLAEQLRVVPT